jgi:hypothetical protein
LVIKGGEKKAVDWLSFEQAKRKKRRHCGCDFHIAHLLQVDIVSALTRENIPVKLAFLIKGNSLDAGAGVGKIFCRQG